MAVTINTYDHLVLKFGDNHMDMDADTFKIELYNSSHVFTAANTARADISANALATNFGYTNPGQNLASVTWAQVTGTTTFDAADTTWSATGGSIGPADDAVIYDDTPTGAPIDPLMFSIDFGASETAGDGTDFKITYNVSGIFTVS